MISREQRRQDVLVRVGDFLLQYGMNAASLRTLAVAAGTSDRMLLYYFADKEELITATLASVADRLTETLNRSVKAETVLPFADLLEAVWNVVGSPELQPYMRLWLELAAAAARGEQPQTTVAASILDGFVNWTANHLMQDQPAKHDESTAMLLAIIEGVGQVLAFLIHQRS